jgi:hypothetical protein
MWWSKEHQYAEAYEVDKNDKKVEEDIHNN